MSASPIARQATQSIPVRRVMLSDASQLPNDYSTTPGGTLYSTTPGGTRVVYERNFLLQLRNSPLSRTPPSNLPNIPESLLKGSVDRPIISPPKENGAIKTVPVKKDANPDEEQFEMDM
ncbi:eukaryotic translation initiation factor 4E-binding protein [Frankliniella occidentalis]|uniref:Eukaryotic translation initiation factor 4E-binding protein n=1 Tax=Frankliniella occidentalis TaxID=133901 RepID=A0A9C6X6F0_FRAOC|nr:eukaryotic translation initiation factor 4E-binding protein [Frankliniella occidentalis]KAE8739620.1 eukaryotic translation initiation factor 4E-binding protein [Frankliniella occidentalis]